MSLGEWSSALLSQKSVSIDSNSDPFPEPIATATSSLTLSDWLKKKKEDFKPENRIQKFVKQAEEHLHEEAYEDAIAMYSKAIELVPTDSHLYTNRSLCHLMIEKYDLCLTDAQKAIELSDESAAKRQKTTKDTTKDYLKYRNKLMYYLKARALRHMECFQEAIDSLVLSKSLAIECQFVDKEISDIKLKVICDLGYDRPDVELVCNQLNSIEDLIKLLKQSKQLMITNDIADQLPSNPFRYCGLYVNGLAPDLKEKKLEELLTTSCGELLRCKVYSNRDQSRAIIAFSDDQSTREAIRTIRSNPDIIRDQSLDNLVFRYRHTCVEGSADLRTDPQIHFKGTEIGGECFKWRTIGCDDSECPALHIPLCLHLDLQSVETKSVDRKRQPIVFDTSTPISSPIHSKRNKSSDRQTIVFDINGTESEETPKSLTSPSKRLKTRLKAPILFDSEDDYQTKDKRSDETLETSGRKRIRLENGSHKETNGLPPEPEAPNLTPKTKRKRIVFDLMDDDRDVDKPKDSPTLKESPKPSLFKPIPPPTPPSGRNVASYDDLFD